MKDLINKIKESRTPKAYSSDATILLNVDELDELQDCLEKGMKAMKYDLDKEENRFHIIKSFYETIADMSKPGDKVELKLREKPNKEL